MAKHKKPTKQVKIPDFVEEIQPDPSYKTSDGQEFPEVSQAIKHQAFLRVREAMKIWIADHPVLYDSAIKLSDDKTNASIFATLLALHHEAIFKVIDAHNGIEVQHA